MVSGASVSGASGSQQVLAANRKPHRKHSSVYLSTGVNGPGMSPNSASQSQGQLSPNIHGHVSGLKSPQSPNPIGREFLINDLLIYINYLLASQLCEKMVQPHSHSTSSKRRPGSSKSAVTQNNESMFIPFKLNKFLSYLRSKNVVKYILYFRRTMTYRTEHFQLSYVTYPFHMTKITDLVVM